MTLKYTTKMNKNKLVNTCYEPGDKYGIRFLQLCKDQGKLNGEDGDR